MKSLNEKLSKELFELEKLLTKLERLHSSFDYLKLKIASPEKIKSWAERVLPNGEIVGEILSSETINFRTHQPERYGLFCEKIFGPIKSWKCKCGKYNGFAIDIICEECEVEIIESRVRRYRMGFIDLACPVVHLWYLKSIPSYLTLMLQLAVEKEFGEHNIEEIIYFQEGKFEDPEQLFCTYGDPEVNKEIKRQKLKNSKSYQFTTSNKSKNNELETIIKDKSNNKRKNSSRNKSDLNSCSYFNNITNKLRGTELLKAALESIDVKLNIDNQRSFLSNLESMENPKLFLRRLRILESFFATKTDLSWMLLTILPVLPPSLRPLLELDNGRLVSADINEIYRLIIIRNRRLFEFRSIFVPDLITTQGRRLLQECVDSLIDNERLPKERQINLNNKALKSLSENLEGKQGRFRQSLLGKRVDYSARSVIVVGPSLRLNQCGLPYQIGIELFQPFLIHELLKTKIKSSSYNTKLANIIIKKNKPFVWTLLTQLMKKYSILLNRAPTLHRFGIQAFDPMLVLGQAIHLHPLVCTGFNADFDGDQMAVHLPLYESSQLEIRTMMRPCYNVLSPANGEVILKPTQDMVIGCYYLTLILSNSKQNRQKYYSNENEAIKAFYQKQINIHTPILVRYKVSNFNFLVENKKIEIDQNYQDLNNKGLLFKEKEIFVRKIFEIENPVKRFYLLTNLGILVAHSSGSKFRPYYLTDLFLDTTPGRLIFSLNFQKNIDFFKYFNPIK